MLSTYANEIVINANRLVPSWQGVGEEDEFCRHLFRAVVISLFTWRRATLDDPLPANERMGWWGDTYLGTQGDKIGSRLWLLSRQKLTLQTCTQAQTYAREALHWLIEDGIVEQIDIQALRIGVDQLTLNITLIRQEKAHWRWRFDNILDALHYGFSPT